MQTSDFSGHMSGRCDKGIEGVRNTVLAMDGIQTFLRHRN